MDYLRSLYPQLDDRKSLHPLHVPAAFVLNGITIFIPGVYTRLLTTFPLLVLLFASTPFYTAGSVGDDYGNASALICALLMYIDFHILTPLERETLEFMGRPESKKDEKAGVTADDCTTLGQKAKWALRFVTIARGIGWNIQVKGVPSHPDVDAARFDFVRKALLRAARSWMYKLLCMFAVGFAVAVRERSTSEGAMRVADVVIGWGGGGWAFNGIKAIYSCAAAVSVALGICEPWEWPPIFGSLSEAWSVRQMWSFVWHQLLRRILQKPGVRLARLLGLRKGTLGSKYLQLYLAFAISMLIHEWQNFNAVRYDAGEIMFFLSQPVAITVEDFLQWCWRKGGLGELDTRFASLATVLGYAWTFAWFSYCLPLFAKRQLDVGINGCGMGDAQAQQYGRQAAIQWLHA